MIIFIISYIGRKILTRIIGHYCHLVAVCYIAYAFEINLMSVTKKYQSIKEYIRIAFNIKENKIISIFIEDIRIASWGSSTSNCVSLINHSPLVYLERCFYQS